MIQNVLKTEEMIQQIINQAKKVHLNLPPDKLSHQTVANNQGKENDLGALCVDTGKFTGRSPKDRFIVKDNYTQDHVDWGDINKGITPESYQKILSKMINHLKDKEIWYRTASAGADEDYQVGIHVINETPWANLFANNLFLRSYNKSNAAKDWTILHAPSFFADPETDGTRSENFTILNLSERIILIGGSAYTGEIKKGIFSILNFLLPIEHNVLSMHCSANEGKDKDVALFFGLSGTGKTTLSTENNRKLIGDDEHGWSDKGIFNFEGGCYAKCIDLSPEKEPEIYGAIKPGALLENIVFFPNSNKVDFSNGTKTENTRVAYPIEHIENRKTSSTGGLPKNIFFLTCDAFGVLPPISRLTPQQAMYYFISGYTAKVAGTEVGIIEPQSTFSACFGKAFLPLHPTKYANMLGDRLNQGDINVWLVNTGWIAGPYGTGERISLKYTRSLIHEALSGELDKKEFKTLPIFNLQYPSTSSHVPAEILNPSASWENQDDYTAQAEMLALQFVENFKQYKDHAEEQIIQAGPNLSKLSI